MTGAALSAYAPRPPLREASLARRTRDIAEAAAGALLLELETSLKPGLVSHIDSGSHDDMDAGTFRRSVAAIAPFLEALARAGGRGAAMGHLRYIGLEAEAAMLAATGGVNTHRGAVFGMGLLCAAAGARATGEADRDLPLGLAVSLLWGSDILNGPVLLRSHGTAVRRRYGAGGARLEAAQGFPSVYHIALPVLRRAHMHSPADEEAARVEACFALIATVADTNLLHRGGLSGLDFAQRSARSFLRGGGTRQSDWRRRALGMHDAFVARRLSPGGSADLLAMALFVDALEGPPRP